MRWIEHNFIKYPARINRVTLQTAYAPPYSAETTHTASIPVTDCIKRNDTVVDDKGITYRVMSSEVVLNKSRLELKVQF